MLSFFWNFIARISRAILSLRYQVHVKGLEKLDAAKLKKGILFLPNHPAHMDPLFLFLFLWPKYRMRPVVIEYIYRLSILKPLMKLVKAIPIPNLDTAVNELKVKRAGRALQEMAIGLKRGESFIIYPAGRLKSSAKEIIGGASGAHALIQECPEAHIVLIRTSGLWGSSFSRALTGRSPDLPKTLMQGLKILWKNGLFFAPRRRVEIEIDVESKDLPRRAPRLTFNRYLEEWFNRYPMQGKKLSDAEPLKLVSYSFWKDDFPSVFQPKIKNAGEEVAISDETKAKIYAEIRRVINNHGIQITPEMNLATDIGMDSLNIADIAAFIMKNYDIDEIHPEDVETVQNILELAEGSRGAEHPTLRTGGPSWRVEKDRLAPILPEGKTLPESFLHVAARMKGAAACADDVIGVLSYRKMQRSALILSLYFRKIPDPCVAVLLPASAGTFLTILALLLAGKIPVMLNWTLGSRSLDEMMRTSNATIVISSWRFLDRLPHVEFGSVGECLHLLEDIREKLSFFQKLRGIFLSLSSLKRVSKALKLHQIDENAPAVILFTSGTEANPKGVPLSHKNILSNQRAAMTCINLNSKDILYGILPPFHSFGFSVAGLFPLFAGIRVAFYPDPTDAPALAEGIDRWKATLFCTAPTFLKTLFSAAQKEQLKTVRFFITGAEKTPLELFKRVENLQTGARIIEGYGITECAPILTLTRPDLVQKGVGHAIPGVEICTIHPETQQLLPEKSEGEICVRGPNIFSGYLGDHLSPFIDIEGVQWYKTGDIGYLDSEGNLILSGRLKRFFKIGGEMISLGAIEEVLCRAFNEKLSEDLPSLAVIVDERIEGKPQLVLFSTRFLDKEEANAILRNGGMSRLVKIAMVKRIEAIPLLGTGKVDYRRLKSQIE